MSTLWIARNPTLAVRITADYTEKDVEHDADGECAGPTGVMEPAQSCWISLMNLRHGRWFTFWSSQISFRRFRYTIGWQKNIQETTVKIQHGARVPDVTSIRALRLESSRAHFVPE